MIRRVYVDSNANKCRLQGFLRPRVQHFRSHRGSVRVPANENEFGSRAAIVSLKFNVNQAVTTVVFGKITDKVIVGFVPITLLFNDDCLFIFDLVDKVAKFVRLLLQFKLLEG